MLLASLVAITRNGCARSAFQPHLAGVFAFWVRTKTCPLFLAEAFYRSMYSSPDQSDLFPGFVPAPQMVFVNDRVSFQTEAKQRVILVHGVAYSHYSLEDRIAEAYALVKLYESGYADQNDLARAFGYSTRTLRRFQQRLHRGGLNALIRPQGRPAEDSISHIAPRDRIILRLKAQGLSNRGIAGRIGLDEKIDRKSTRLNSSHVEISYAVFCLKKKKEYKITQDSKN